MINLLRILWINVLYIEFIINIMNDNMSLNNINVLNIQKMIFVYNALLNGWTVKLINNNKFEFVKATPNTKLKKEVNLENYLKNFIIDNLNIDNMNIDTIDTMNIET